MADVVRGSGSLIPQRATQTTPHRCARSHSDFMTMRAFFREASRNPGQPDWTPAGVYISPTCIQPPQAGYLCRFERFFKLTGTEMPID